MEMISKYICFCIFVTSINGIKNTSQFHVNAYSEDYDYLKDSSSHKEIFVRFNSKLTELQVNLKIKTLELENENLKLKERLMKIEENLRNTKEDFRRIEEEQKEIREILKKIENSAEYSTINLMRIEGEQKETKDFLVKTNDNLKNSEEGFRIIEKEQKETKEILKIFDSDLNELKADLEENKERVEKSEEGLKKVVEEDIKVTKEDFKVMKDELKLKSINERNEILNFILSKKVSHYHFFTDINGKNKAFIIPLDGMKIQTFNDCVNLCKNFNSTLIEIESKEKQLILESFLSRLGHEFLSKQFPYFWINGLRDSSGVWKWLKINTQFTFTNWETNYPITYSDHNNIYVTAYSTHAFGKWYNTRITVKVYVMCEHSFGFS